MKRDMIKIDEEKCNGCGLCIPNCHEGALQIIDNKARLVSDLMCDGLGACLGYCPQGALTIEEREAEAYDEYKVMAQMVEKGKNTVIAHLTHMKDHNEMEFLRQGIEYLQKNEAHYDFSLAAVMFAVHNSGGSSCGSGGGSCPGSAEQAIKPKATPVVAQAQPQQTELRHWPVQMHLVNPSSAYFRQSDLLLAADCSAYALPDFHSNHLKGKTLAIACPKLDSGQESYLQKLIALIDEAKVNTITVLIMEVPCCGGLLQLAKRAAAEASRKVPIKVLTVSIEGEILQEEWV